MKNKNEKRIGKDSIEYFEEQWDNTINSWEGHRPHLKYDILNKEYLHWVKLIHFWRRKCAESSQFIWTLSISIPDLFWFFFFHQEYSFSKSQGWNWIPSNRKSPEDFIIPNRVFEGPSQISAFWRNRCPKKRNFSYWVCDQPENTLYEHADNGEKDFELNKEIRTKTIFFRKMVFSLLKKQK